MLRIMFRVLSLVSFSRQTRLARTYVLMGAVISWFMALTLVHPGQFIPGHREGAAHASMPSDHCSFQK